MTRSIWFVILALAATTSATEISTVGRDKSGNAFNGFTNINTVTGVGMPITLDPTFTYGYIGGLTEDYATGFVYAVANNGSGDVFLQTLGPGRAANPPGVALGPGFLNGLTYDSANGHLYAVSSGGATAELVRVSAGESVPVASLASLTVGFTDGGLTFDPATGLFYFLSDDGSGASRVFSSISLAGTVSHPYDLGTGSISFNGGLVYDRTTPGLFYTIGNDAIGNSSLYSFHLTGGGALTTVLSDFGSGFDNEGLTELTPEPSAAILFAAGLGVIAAWKVAVRYRARNRAGESTNKETRTYESI